MSSVRDYLTPEPLMFVTDLTRGQRGNGLGSSRSTPATRGSAGHVPPTKPAAIGPSCPQLPSIYERVREKKRKLELDVGNCGDLRQRLEALREERDACTQRYKLRRRRELDMLIDELEEDLRKTESGEKVKEFVEASEPYLKAFQRQQFCRPQSTAQAPDPTKEGSPVLSLVGGVARQLPSGSAPHLSRQSVVQDYAVAMEGEAPAYDIEAKDTCKACGEPVQLHTGLSMLVCVKCGATHPFLDATAALLSFSDDSYDYASFSYKRINHFTEWISAMQAKEATEIPQSVLDSVMQKLAERRIQSSDEITVHKVREALKELKLRKYYEHTQLIACKITGRAPPRMSPTQEERIKLLFMAASTAFQQLCPPDRSNFLSYSFTLYKFSELLGYTEFLPNFALLRGQAKLRRQDEIYKALCEALDWEFIPSIST